MSQMVLLCMISNDCMALYWGPRGAYVMSYQANAILKTYIYRTYYSSYIS